MKKNLIMIACLLLTVAAVAQEYGTRVPEDNPPAIQRLFFGGSFGLCYPLSRRK